MPSTTWSEEAADALTRMIDVINEQGWCQRSLKTDDGRVCLYGALYEATGVQLIRNPEVLDTTDDHEGRAWNLVWGSSEHCAQQHRLRGLIESAITVRLRADAPSCDLEDGLSVWNDRYAQSADDVIHVLKLAREDLLARGDQ